MFSAVLFFVLQLIYKLTSSNIPVRLTLLLRNHPLTLLSFFMDDVNKLNPVGGPSQEILKKGDLLTCYLPLKKKARVLLNTL